MTRERARAARERCERATAGPWEHLTQENPLNDLGKEKLPNSVPLVEHWVTTAWEHPQLKAKMPIATISSGPFHERTHTIRIREEDAEFWAHSRQDCPDALDMLERAMAIVEVWATSPAAQELVREWRGEARGGKDAHVS